MQILKRIPLFGCLALLVYMPFHVFLAQSLSLLTGGLEAWKIGKDVILVLLALFTICLVFWQGKANRIFRISLVLTVAYGILHLLLWLIKPDIYARAAELGLIYNVRVPLFALTALGAYLVYPLKFAFSSVMKIAVVVSTVVAFLGIMQYFLPNDILTHVGYSVQRGVLPSFAIDSNPLFPRVMSTLREPNALAAYLLVPIVALTLLVVRDWKTNRRLILSGALLLHLLALALTQSRSGLIALALGLAMAGWWRYRNWCVAVLRRFWYVGVGLLLVAAVGIFTLRSSHFIQAYVIHTSNARTSELDSNELHWQFAQRGLKGIAGQPLGHGPGTAGLASIQNPAGSFLTENYYIQIGYEVGVLGLGLFVAINVCWYRWLRQRKDLWSVVVLASFWGYVVTNMLLHTWSNEAVAAQWWLLAGLAVGTYSRPAPAKTKR
jgi:hypothetical protein